MTRTDAPSGKAAARLVDLAGTLFLTVVEPNGRQASAPVELADLLTPELAARRIERVTSVRPALHCATRQWAAFVAAAALHGGPAK